MDYINKILCGHDLEILPKLPSESVNCVVTSPPYWSLRDYGIEPVIWDGDKNCKHDFNEYDSKLLHENRQNLDGGTLGNPEYRKNLHGFGKAKAGFCSKCGAWRGNLGLEPTFELYVKHLCDIFDEIKRVLRKDGVCFVNIGDSYGGSGNASGHREHTKNLGYKTLEMGASQGNQRITRGYKKSLLDIPYRFSIEMINRGWIKRNTIIWKKPNCMPASANDRFTVDFEYLFFFTKNNKAIFWTNEKTLECVDKQPLGIKGIEGKDWEWIKCPRCQGTGGETKINKKDAEKMGSPRARYHRITKQEICKRCKGLGKVKVSLWTGHDYWFEQQFDPILTDSIKRELRGNRLNKYSKDKHLPKGVHPNTMSQVREYRGYDHLEEEISNRAGRNKRCVWIIPTQPFPEAHFAVYPEGLIEIPIKAGCPEFICKKCGKARVKILELTEGYKKLLGKSWHPHKHDAERGMSETPNKKASCTKEYNFMGYTDCGCNAGWESGIVCDPFMGAGTTALVALKQRKRFIGIEIKQEYINMANKRIARVQQKIF